MPELFTNTRPGLDFVYSALDGANIDAPDNVIDLTHAFGTKAGLPTFSFSEPGKTYSM